MTKFTEALRAQIDPMNLERPKSVKLLNKPITLNESLNKIEKQHRYILNLSWSIGIWIDSSAYPDAIENARIGAINELNRLIYGEIFSNLYELKYLINYGEIESCLNIIDSLIEKVGVINEI
jgi:hypothetical protein